MTRMDRPPEPSLIKVTEIFLIPNSFLVAALGTADTNLHRAMVSALGLIISGLWWICSTDAFADHLSAEPVPPKGFPNRRMRLLSWLPFIFITGWFLSLVIHLLVWNRPLGS
jgi:hypothetical protein